MKPVITACLAAAACLHGYAFAQAIPAIDFARHPEVFEVALSPDGKHVAIAAPTPNGLETQLQIVGIESGQTQVLRFGKLEHVSDIVWSAEDRVVLARASNLPLRPKPYSRGQLFSTDLTGKDQETLFGYFRHDGIRAGRHNDEGFASVVKVLDREPGKVLVSFTCWNCGEEPDTVVYKVDAASGERKEIERIGQPANLIFDHSGRARIQVVLDGEDNPVVSYRPTADSDWKPMPKSLIGFDIDFGRFAQDDRTLFAAVSDDGEAARMYRIDLESGTRIALPSTPGIAPAYYELAGHDGTPFAVVYDENKPIVQYLDPSSEFAILHARLIKAFPGHMVSFDGFSRDNSVVLLRAWSDRDPATWYLFNRKTEKVTVVAESRPWIRASSMAPTQSVAFASADGTQIHGFYTAHGNDPRPLIVIPHGGPHGIYDTWDFDSDAQFFANRGYGVLRVNFRGSGGRGHDFESSGYREWGGKMQDDIAAGVKWAIGKGLTDPKRVCTYGASYGGYAALMQTIRFPELYRCAIGYVGVYDLALMKREGDIDDTRRGRRYLDRVLGTDEGALVANSPARNVDRIRVPVFLAQGTIDRRVPMAQFKALRNAMEASGVKVETMVATGEGHGFYKPETRAELYQRVEQFLDSHAK